MSTQTMRLSRISHPRASLWAMLLLIVVFLGFGVVAEACLVDHDASATMKLEHHPELYADIKN